MDLMLILPIISSSKFFKQKFFSTLFLLFTLLGIFVFRMFLVEIDSQLSAFDNLEYLGSMIHCVQSSEN